MAYKFQADLGWLRMQGEDSSGTAMIAVLDALNKLPKGPIPSERETQVACNIALDQDWVWEAVQEELKESYQDAISRKIEELFVDYVAKNDNENKARIALLEQSLADLRGPIKQPEEKVVENEFEWLEKQESVTLADDIERSENPVDKAARAYVASATKEVCNLLGPDPDELVVCYDKGEPEHFLEPGHTAVIPCNTAAHEDVPDLKLEKANAIAEAVTQKREETGLIKTDNKDECFEELQKMHKPSGLTIKDLAKGIGAPYSTVQSWFNNKNRTSLKEKLPKLRKFYAEQAKVERTLMSFYCNVCGASFPSLAALTGHKSSHSHIKTLAKPAEPAKPQFNRPYWATPPENYSPESFKIDWNTCAQVISEAGNATSYENLVNRIADRVLSEDRAFQILVKFDHLFQAARTAKNEGGEAVRNAKIEAQKELMPIAKEGKVAFG